MALIAVKVVETSSFLTVTVALNAQIKLQKRTILQLLFSAFNQSWILYVQFVNSFLFHLLILYQPT